ncbi:thioredoxin [Rickettsiales endosymbiont of Peranema trichophorum]|uniref:thioredoxin n=1 Tax=Rickettsiales endosymbiont of Peranema trichophorum TaxID=2486577 RepID=UPI001022BCDB|nr:thioredoxin [Rickettsiales endosymbiont of Peranema trichophorum]RZI47272.1 thioredoxin [Rickettsiales endosymbiont of Peranema trichophorum]
MIGHVTDDAFDQVVGQSKGYVLVHFWAAWCVPCRELSEVLEKVDEKMAHRLQILKINMSTEMQMATKLGVRGMPTMVLFKDGQYVKMKPGVMDQKSVEEWLEESMGPEKSA